MLKEVTYEFPEETFDIKEGQAHFQQASSSPNLVSNDREELIVEDMEIVENKEEDYQPDLSLISRVSESMEDNRLVSKSPICQDHFGKETLFGISLTQLTKR